MYDNYVPAELNLLIFHQKYFLEYYFTITEDSCSREIFDCLALGGMLIGIPASMFGEQIPDGFTCGYNTTASIIGPRPNTSYLCTIVSTTDGPSIHDECPQIYNFP